MSKNKNMTNVNEVNKSTANQTTTNSPIFDRTTKPANQTTEVKTVIVNGETIELKRDFKNPFDKTDRPQKQGVLFFIAELVKNSPEGLTKSQVLEVLANKFLDRAVKSMSQTVSVQLPTRLAKDKGFIFETKVNGDGQKVYIYKGQKEVDKEVNKETI